MRYGNMISHLKTARAKSFVEQKGKEAMTLPTPDEYAAIGRRVLAGKREPTFGERTRQLESDRAALWELCERQMALLLRWTKEMTVAQVDQLMAETLESLGGAHD